VNRNGVSLLKHLGWSWMVIACPAPALLTVERGPRRQNPLVLARANPETKGSTDIGIP
jgi:hypothetical protein